eukprot:jgi/Ulvmu1/7197/UM034_0106.1
MPLRAVCSFCVHSSYLIDRPSKQCSKRLFQADGHPARGCGSDQNGLLRWSAKEHAHKGVLTLPGGAQPRSIHPSPILAESVSDSKQLAHLLDSMLSHDKSNTMSNFGFYAAQLSQPPLCITSATETARYRCSTRRVIQQAVLVPHHCNVTQGRIGEERSVIRAPSLPRC